MTTQDVSMILLAALLILMVLGWLFSVTTASLVILGIGTVLAVALILGEAWERKQRKVVKNNDGGSK